MTDEDEAYEIGKRDGYESAIQDLDIATGGDGEFRASSIPGRTVDVAVMKQRVIERAQSVLAPDEWVTVWAALRSRAHSLREMAGEPHTISSNTRAQWYAEAVRLDVIVQKLATAMGQI